MSQTGVNHESTYRTPRWVMAVGILVILLLVVIGLALLSGREHGPGLHMPPASVTQEHNQPGAQHP